MRRLLVLLTLLAVTAASPALTAEQNIKTIMDTANQAFQAKDYAGAAKYYSEAEVLLSKTFPASFLRARLLSNIATAKKQIGHDTALGATRITGGWSSPRVVVVDLLSSFPLLDGTPREQFMHVALHEIGHAIKLDHSESKGDVMYATLSKPIRTTLSENDKARAKALYPH